jgi:FkbM family methyltransferase
LIKNMIRRSRIFPALRHTRTLLRSLLWRKPWIYKAFISNRTGIVRLGTDYGGKDVLDDTSLYGATIISAGLGEDASFDIEFARKFGARVILIDPTPRALMHYEEISKCFGVSSSLGTGRCSYDLSGVSLHQLVMVNAALWNEDGEVTFYLPVETDFVSHSIVNYQNNYRSDTPSITVTAKTIFQIAADLGIDLNSVPLIKLDIEGAEIEVIQHFLAAGLRPQQICVEFDELQVKSRRGAQRVEMTHRQLVAAGYRAASSDGHADFLYIRNSPS